MRIYYLPNGDAVSCVWERDKAFLESIPYSFIEIDETQENLPKLKEINTALSSPVYDRIRVLEGVLYYNDSQIVFNTDQDRLDLKTEYQKAVIDLGKIIDAPQITSITLVAVQQIQAAVQYEAKVLRIILKIIYKIIAW